MRCSTNPLRSEPNSGIPQLKFKIIQLYSQTLKYQIQLARQYARPVFFRLLRDSVSVDGWKNLKESIIESEAGINSILTMMDSGHLRRVSTTLSDVHGTMEESFSLLKDTKSSVEVIVALFLF